MLLSFFFLGAIPEFDSPCVFLQHGAQSHRFANPALPISMMQQAAQHVAAALRHLRVRLLGL